MLGTSVELYFPPPRSHSLLFSFIPTLVSETIKPKQDSLYPRTVNVAFRNTVLRPTKSQASKQAS